MLLASGNLAAVESECVAFLLLGSDPVEDAVEVLVVDDDAGIEVGVILRVEAGGEYLAIGANGHGTVLRLADGGHRAAQPAGSRPSRR